MKKHKLGWLLIVPVVLAFSASLVGTAIAGRSTVEMKAGALIPHGAHEESGVLVAVAHDGRFRLFKSYFGVAPKQEVCWVSNEIAHRVDVRYRTRTRTIRVRGRGDFTMQVVSKGNAQHIRRILGRSQARCTFVSTTERTFFLPLDGHTS